MADAAKRKKGEKIPYQEYKLLKEKEAKRKFKIYFYPWPVLAAVLIPLAVLIIMAVYYFLAVKWLPE